MCPIYVFKKQIKIYLIATFRDIFNCPLSMFSNIQIINEFPQGGGDYKNLVDKKLI